MKKKVLVFLFIGVFLLICGCSNNSSGSGNGLPSVKQISAPEPYEMAIREIEAQNLDKALRYLDLVIKDFQNYEEYVYRAHLLKTIIYADYYSANIGLTNALLEGIKDNPFLKPEETEQILDSTQSILDETSAYKQPFLESAMHVYGHYEKYKDIDFQLHYSTADNSTEALNDVEWFRKCGTPMPSQDQINIALSDAKVYLLGLSFDELIKNSKINYPAYFYSAGGVSSEWDKDFAKKMVQKIIEITDDDKYNEYRLDAEDALKNFK